MNKKCFLLAFKTSIPVLFGYLAIGIAFGLLVVENDYPWWIATIMSISMYAGAGQYIAIGLFAAGTSISTILITELLVNIRHIVYGLSLISKFNTCGKWKPYLIFSLTDETYSLLTTTEVPEEIETGNFYGTISLLNHLYWIIGSSFGAIVGSVIPFDLTGVDFSLTALFVVLAIEQIEKSKFILPPLIGGITTLTTIILWKTKIIGDSNNILIIALTCGISILVLLRETLEKNINPKIQTDKNYRNKK